jgi:hypothetical protein
MPPLYDNRHLVEVAEVDLTSLSATSLRPVMNWIVHRHSHLPVGRPSTKFIRPSSWQSFGLAAAATPAAAASSQSVRLSVREARLSPSAAVSRPRGSSQVFDTHTTTAGG